MTVNTGVSVADYFAKKMAALKQVAVAPQDSLAHAEIIAVKVLTLQELFSCLCSLVQNFLVECNHKAAYSQNLGHRLHVMWRAVITVLIIDYFLNILVRGLVLL